MPSPGSDYRRRIAEAIRAAADYPIVAEWICCDPVNPDHDLCVKGDIARQMLRAVLADDEEKLYLPSGIVDAVLAVRDDVLEELRSALERRIDADAEALARLDALIAAGFGATTDTLRELRAGLGDTPLAKEAGRG